MSSSSGLKDHLNLAADLLEMESLCGTSDLNVATATPASLSEANAAAKGNENSSFAVDSAAGLPIDLYYPFDDDPCNSILPLSSTPFLA